MEFNNFLFSWTNHGVDWRCLERNNKPSKGKQMTYLNVCSVTTVTVTTTTTNLEPNIC